MAKRKTVNLVKKHKNPKGGLSAAGRRAYNKATGSNLKAPVKGKPKTTQQIRRKGSFLVRMGSAKGRLFDAKGRKTRLKLSLEAWGYYGKSKPQAVAMGRRLLARYRKTKK
jgi:hypothetical protein